VAVFQKKKAQTVGALIKRLKKVGEHLMKNFPGAEVKQKSGVKSTGINGRRVR